MIRRLVALTVLAAPAFGVLAGGGPYIEITATACEFEGQPDVGSVRARWVFDAGATPASVLPVGITFDALAAEAWFTQLASCDDAFASPTSTLAPGDVGSASLFYSITGQSLLLTIESADGTRSATLLVSSAAASFAPGMTSLPDEPGAYAPVAPRHDLAINAEAPGLEVLAAWSADTGDDMGRVRLGARVLEAPPAVGCSLSDVAPPFGVLDFSDVFEFIAVFGAGCP